MMLNVFKRIIMKDKFGILLVNGDDTVDHLFKAIRQLRYHYKLDFYIRDFYDEEFWGYEVILALGQDRVSPELFLYKDNISQLGMISCDDGEGRPIVTTGKPELLLKLKIGEDNS